MSRNESLLFSNSLTSFQICRARLFDRISAFLKFDPPSFRSCQWKLFISISLKLLQLGCRLEFMVVSESITHCCVSVLNRLLLFRKPLAVIATCDVSAVLCVLDSSWDASERWFLWFNISRHFVCFKVSTWAMLLRRVKSIGCSPWCHVFKKPYPLYPPMAFNQLVSANFWFMPCTARLTQISQRLLNNAENYG